MKNTILLVEDSADDIFFFKRAVERSGCDADVCHVGSAKEAMAYLESKNGLGLTHPLPAMLFVDLLLPNIRGNHLVKWIKGDENCRGVPVIVFTGALSRRTASDLAGLGANAIMIKPTIAGELDEAIGAACTFWLKYCVHGGPLAGES